ncbi:MAG: flagellar hook-basal body complex protein, partial [Pseudomonadales bacterium]|nr:flagellar hook-basal body complex protein [Pseudomonadales bacterium]
MPFNIALSGLKASSLDLEVTGNNIANAGTVGFKQSRVEFGDLYANSFLSSSSNPVGDGVQVQDVRQLFGQGNINFTDRGLDLAISGDGFFIVDDGDQTKFTRAGQFGVDKDGFVVNNTG